MADPSSQSSGGNAFDDADSGEVASCDSPVPATDARDFMCPGGQADRPGADQDARVPVELNAGTHLLPSTTLAELFERQVAMTPDALAIACGDAELTYRELNFRANRLAHRLRRCGVGSETAVAILQERSIDLIVSILAVLKAGGTYVPLHNGHPAARLRYVVEQSGATALLTDRTFIDAHW